MSVQIMVLMSFTGCYLPCPSFFWPVVLDKCTLQSASTGEESLLLLVHSFYGAGAYYSNSLMSAGAQSYSYKKKMCSIRADSPRCCLLMPWLACGGKSKLARSNVCDSVGRMC